MKLEWKDVSSWSQSDTERSQPKSVELSTPSGVRLKVHRHISWPGEWCMSVHGGQVDFRFGPIPLVEKDLSEAKNEALKLLTDMLKETLGEFL